MQIAGHKIDNKTMLYGGGAVVALIGVFWLMNRNSAAAANGDPSVPLAYTIPFSTGSGNVADQQTPASQVDPTQGALFDFSLDMQRLKNEALYSSNAASLFAGLPESLFDRFDSFAFDYNTTGGNTYIGWAGTQNPSIVRPEHPTIVPTPAPVLPPPPMVAMPSPTPPASAPPQTVAAPECDSWCLMAQNLADYNNRIRWGDGGTGAPGAGSNPGGGGSGD